MNAAVLGIVGVDERIGVLEVTACDVKRRPVHTCRPAADAIEVGDKQVRLVLAAQSSAKMIVLSIGSSGLFRRNHRIRVKIRRNYRLQVQIRTLDHPDRSGRIRTGSDGFVAEGKGFEPLESRNPQRLSRPSHSSALATFRGRG